MTIKFKNNEFESDFLFKNNSSLFFRSKITQWEAFPMSFNMSSFNTVFTSDTHPYQILLPLGLILILAKLFSLGIHKLKIPQVIGFLISGLAVGLITFIPNQTILTDYTLSGLDIFAKIGVILIMFSAGLGTDIKKVKAVGVQSVIITSLGVIVPMLFGFVLSFVFDKVTGGSLEMRDSNNTLLVPAIYTELYYGVVLTATSVSITVATLKELGRLNSKVGMSLVSAAILDDIIGIILLSLILSLAKSGSNTNDTSTFAGMIMNATGSNSTALSVILIIAFMLAFFVITFLGGKLLKRLFNWLGSKYPHHIRITILALGVCFIWSYLAEFFNIADITGAYMIGLILAETNTEKYIDHRSETIADNIFAPVFFACIAMNMYTSKTGFDINFLIFGLLWVVVGLLGKVVGAGCGALISRYSFKDSLRVGIGMMARAEVVIVCAQKGVDGGLISSQLMVYTLVLILVSSFLTPIFLKMSYKNEVDQTTLEKPKPTENPNNIEVK